MGIIKRIWKAYIRHFKPLQYAKLVGVNFGGVYIYTALLIGLRNHGL